MLRRLWLMLYNTYYLVVLWHLSCTLAFIVQ